MNQKRWTGEAGARVRGSRMKITGRRLEQTSPQREQSGRGKDRPPRRGERRRIRQMAVSAMLLVVVVAVKLAFPNVMERYRQQMLRLLGEDTDFVAAFASVGKAVSPDGKLGDTINGVYTAVFGPEKVTVPEEDGDPAEKPEEPPHTDGEGRVIYTPDNIPENACMTQKVLGFAYAPPVEGTVTSGFGYREHPVLGGEKFHYGMDIGAESGTTIRAFAAGTVTVVAEASELGKYVIISHPDGYTSLYGHCSAITASSGQQVAMGDPIAEVGDTGMTTGPHLHFELMQNSVYLNPTYYALG